MGLTFFFLITLHGCHALSPPPFFYMQKVSTSNPVPLTLKAAKLAYGVCHYSRSIAIMACFTERQLWLGDAVGDHVRVKWKVRDVAL